MPSVWMPLFMYAITTFIIITITITIIIITIIIIACPYSCCSDYFSDYYEAACLVHVFAMFYDTCTLKETW